MPLPLRTALARPAFVTWLARMVIAPTRPPDLDELRRRGLRLGCSLGWLRWCRTVRGLRHCFHLFLLPREGKGRRFGDADHRIRGGQHRVGRAFKEPAGRDRFVGRLDRRRVGGWLLDLDRHFQVRFRVDRRRGRGLATYISQYR